MRNTASVLFDLDGTLYKGKQRYVILDLPPFLADRDLFSEEALQEIKALHLEYSNGPMERPEFARLLVEGYYRGLADQTCNAVEEATSAFWLERDADPETWYHYSDPLIRLMRGYAQDLNNRGWDTKLVLISGSPEDALRQVAAKFGFNGLYATKGRTFNGSYTGEVLRELGTADAKRDLLASLPSFEPGRSLAFGDSSSDVPLFERVDPRNCFLLIEGLGMVEQYLRGELPEATKSIKEKAALVTEGRSSGWHVLDSDDDVLGVAQERLEE